MSSSPATDIGRSISPDEEEAANDAEGARGVDWSIRPKSRALWLRPHPILICLLVLVMAAFCAMMIGRSWVPPNEILRILADHALSALPFVPESPVRQTWTAAEESVILQVRLPRILLGVLVGGGLALGGACLQALFRNPLVSPDIIGVTAGASLGGVLAMMLGLSSLYLVANAFGFGLLALLFVLLLAKLSRGGAILMIVLGGIVIAAFFNACVSFLTYIADPYSELPSIVHWLLGSLASANYEKVVVALVPIILGSIVILGLRWRINVLSLGDEDAIAMGVNPRILRPVLLGAVALMTAGTVAVAGAVSWVGLVVPHLARLWVGTDHRVLLPTSILLGGIYLVLVDTLSRTLTSSELPLGILTAIIGAPVFVTLLVVSMRRGTLHGL